MASLDWLKHPIGSAKGIWSFLTEDQFSPPAPVPYDHRDWLRHICEETNCASDGGSHWQANPSGHFRLRFTADSRDHLHRARHALREVLNKYRIRHWEALPVYWVGPGTKVRQDIQLIDWRVPPPRSNGAVTEDLATVSAPLQQGRPLLDVVQILATLIAMGAVLYPLGLLIFQRKLVTDLKLGPSPSWYAASLLPEPAAYALGVNYAAAPVGFALMLTFVATTCLVLLAIGVYEAFLHPLRSNVHRIPQLGSWMYSAIDGILYTIAPTLISLGLVAWTFRRVDFDRIPGTLNWTPSLLFASMVILLVVACVINLGLSIVTNLAPRHDAFEFRPPHPSLRYYLKRFYVASGLGIVMYDAFQWFVASRLFDLNHSEMTASDVAIGAINSWMLLVCIGLVDLILMVAMYGKSHHLDRMHGRAWMAVTLMVLAAGTYAGFVPYFVHLDSGQKWTLYLAGAGAGVGAYLLVMMFRRHMFSVGTLLVALIFSYFPSLLPAYWGASPFKTPPYLPLPVVGICKTQRGHLFEGELLNHTAGYWTFIVQGKVPGLHHPLERDAIYSLRTDRVDKAVIWNAYGGKQKTLSTLCTKPSYGTRTKYPRRRPHTTSHLPG